MKNLHKLSLHLALVVLCVALLPLQARAECLISGEITAELNTDNPNMPGWKYTLSLSWDLQPAHGLSHFDVLLGDPGECLCVDFEAAIAWENPAGYSDGESEDCSDPDALVYDLILNCEGDPSIDYGWPLLKFEPREDGCEPGPTGTGVFVFYSPYGPAPIADPNLFLVDKHSQFSCFGLLTGMFPGIPCDPTPTATSTWGSIKVLYTE